MRLVTYESEGRWHSGVAIGDRVVNTATAAEAAQLSIDSTIDWTSNRSIIQITSAETAKLESAARQLAESESSAHTIATVHLGPPIPNPDKIICLGLNYRSHAEEAGFKVPTVPILFAKFRNALTGPHDPIVLPSVSDEIDYEGELAVVIGKPCKDVPVDDALTMVAGYMAFNDVSARDVQMRTSQWLSGKTLNTFAPCGPALVVNEIGDPQALNLSTRVNGQTLQQSNTRMMIFSVAESIAYISRLMTLQPGDIIATGTPEGVGFKRTPAIFLKPGDVVEVEIDDIGCLRNPVLKAGGKEGKAII
ncbi:MAG TPA: fumarylacetoacetate hydrolase family protein [Anaerolineae bacterium]|nr:fumarylacetoacetate hydrolase family protein [Anaerolineae bacterium]